MINATKGAVLINGQNIKTHTDDVRKLMGLCPQHNILFPDLNVQEHLKFFARVWTGLKRVDVFILFCFFVVERVENSWWRFQRDAKNSWNRGKSKWNGKRLIWRDETKALSWNGFNWEFRGNILLLHNSLFLITHVFLIGFDFGWTDIRNGSRIA